jgi:hypothetical protein
MKTGLILAAAAGSLGVMAVPANAAVFEEESEARISVPGFSTGDIAPATSPAALLQKASYADPDWDDWDDDDDWRERRRDREGRWRGGRRADRWDDRVYDRRGRYVNPRRIGRRDRIWRGRDGRYYCERDNGTTGLVIGAGLGALLGRTVDTRGDRTVGTLLGGALGAVLGREIDRGDVRCR